MKRPRPPTKGPAKPSLSATLMGLAGQTAPVAADFDAVKKAIEADGKRLGDVPKVFARMGLRDTYDDELKKAEAGFRENPESPLHRLLLADAQRHAGRNIEAIANLRKCLDHPDTEMPARYFLAALGAEPMPDKMPHEMVRSLFDQFADTFDRDLVTVLKYQGPKLLENAIAEADKLADRPPRADLDVIDIGCGTGLSAVPFRSRAASLTGIDISARMLDQARERGVYDALIRGDVVTELEKRPESADLIIAGDVFIYLGEVEPALKACRIALRPYGLVALTTESSDKEDLVLGPSGRYRYSDAYVRAGAEKSGLSVEVEQPGMIRFERGVAVEGTTFVLSVA